MKLMQSRSIASFKNQRGMMLIEGLIAILVFSLGVLAMVGMQAQSVSHTSQAKYRVDAAFLANKLIAQMWTDAPANRPSYATGGTNFNTWVAQELNDYLPPGRSSAIVTVTFIPNPTQNILINPTPPALVRHKVTVQIQWRGPNEPNSVPAHTYTTSTDIISS